MHHTGEKGYLYFARIVLRNKENTVGLENTGDYIGFELTNKNKITEEGIILDENIIREIIARYMKNQRYGKEAYHLGTVDSNNMEPTPTSENQFKNWVRQEKFRGRIRKINGKKEENPYLKYEGVNVPINGKMYGIYRGIDVSDKLGKYLEVLIRRVGPHGMVNLYEAYVGFVTKQRRTDEIRRNPQGKFLMFTSEKDVDTLISEGNIERVLHLLSYGRRDYRDASYIGHIDKNGSDKNEYCPDEVMMINISHFLDEYKAYKNKNANRKDDGR